MSAEFRRDPDTGAWHIAAPARAERPGGAVRAEPELEPDAGSDDDPFLEGREERTPHEVYALRPDHSRPNTPGWRVRVVPNQYPAVEGADESPIISVAPFERRAGRGRHEVVIECPHFETCLGRLEPAHVRDVLFVYRERLRQLRDEGRWACALVFKNKGRAAGATIPHSHSQLIALPFVPEAVRAEVARARQRFERTGEPFTEWTATGDEDRVVATRPHALAYCPFASRFPFECRIVPTESVPRFEEAPDTSLHDTANLLRNALHALYASVGEAPYNLVLRTLPFAEPGPAPWYRWSLDLLPRIGMIGGYELAAGAMINPLTPETAATTLRTAWPANPSTA